MDFQATQRDLLDRQTQLDYLQRRSDDLHSCLPGTSINQPNTTMDQIHDKIRDLEEKIDASIKKSRDDIMVQTDKPTEVIHSEEQKESDVISTTSTGGQSLTLEVQVIFYFTESISVHFLITSILHISFNEKHLTID